MADGRTDVQMAERALTDELRLPEQRRAHRREMLRARTADEIKDVARGLLRLGPAAQLSMRAVAREVGITPSGLYRYYDGHQALVMALAGDAYACAGDALSSAAASAHGTRAQALAMAHAYRAWAAAHREEFALMFSTDPGVVGDLGSMLDPGQVNRFFAAPIANFTEGVETGAIVLPPPLQAPSALSPLIEELRQLQERPLAPHHLSALLGAWAALHGFVALELFGPLGWFYDDTVHAYDRHARGVLASIGYVTPG